MKCIRNYNAHTIIRWRERATLTHPDPEEEGEKKETNLYLSVLPLPFCASFTSSVAAAAATHSSATRLREYTRAKRIHIYAEPSTLSYDTTNECLAFCAHRTPPDQMKMNTYYVIISV